MCPPGTSQNTTNYTLDQCPACNPEQYQDLEGQTGRRWRGKKIMKIGGLILLFTACKDCQPGRYAAENSTKELMCEIGHYCPGECMRLPCEPGTYQDKRGQIECWPW